MRTAFLLICSLLSLQGSYAQSRPTEDCNFADSGFATSPGQSIQIGEVKGKLTLSLQSCGSPTGCVEAPVAQGTPVQIYRRQAEWTCGYVAGNDGAGPAWIRTDALSPVNYGTHPTLSAWTGAWVGGEDHVHLRYARKSGALQIKGSAVWHGEHTSHLGDIEGSATPFTNHLHFVEGGCTVDLTLLGRYILAADNQACGGLNARFEGLWKRIGR